MKVISLLKEKYHAPLMSKVNVTIFLCLILFIGAFLRLCYLSTPSFSSDDIKSIETIEKAGIGSIVGDALKRGHPPFYFIILHYWTSMFGFSEFALRLPTAIFGILSVFVIFRLSSLVFDNKTALISALLLAVNPEHFFSSYALKQYTLTVMLGLLSIYLLLTALKEHRTMLWIAFGIANVALLCTHYSATFILLTEIFYIAIVFRKYRYTLQIFLTTTGISLLVVVLLLFLQERSLQLFFEPRWIAKLTLEKILNIFTSFIAGFYIKIPENGVVFTDTIHFKNQGLYIDALPFPAKIGILTYFIFFLLLGLKARARDVPLTKPISLTEDYKPLIYTWAIIPILANLLIEYFSLHFARQEFVPARYHLFWSCSILLLIARGFVAIGKLRFICLILLISISIHLFPIITAESNPRRLNWKGVANRLREMVSDGETVHFLSSNFASLPLRYYYKGDIYIGLDKVFEKITPSVMGGRSEGVFLIKAGESNLPVGLTRNLDMFYINKEEVKQFYHINITHCWKPRF